MTRTRRLVLSTSLVIASLAAGAGTAMAAAPEAGALTARLPAHGGSFGGPLQRAMALGSLSDTQRAQVQALIADQKAHSEPARAARLILREVLADQVAHGAIDRAALKPQFDAEASADAAKRAARKATVEKLVTILTPAQRAALGGSILVGAAFRADTSAKGERLVDLVEAALPLLTNDQRAIAEKKLREHP